MKKVLLLLLFSHTLLAQPTYHFDLLKDINSITNDADIRFIRTVGNTAIVFQLDRDNTTNMAKLRLWSYNGKTLKNFASSDLFEYYTNFYLCSVIDDYIFFHAYKNSDEYGLYVVKLNSPEIKKVGAYFSNLKIVKFQSKIYYSVLGTYDEEGVYYYNELTNVSTRIQPGNSTFTRPNILKATNNKIYFLAYDTSSSPTPYLWVTDGTIQGTRKLKDVTQQNLSATSIGQIGNLDIFNTNGSLYLTDGTEAGTQPFVSMSSFTSSPNPVIIFGRFFSFGNKAFFTVKINDSDELWVTDGTTVNTKFVANTTKVCLFDNNEVASKDGFIFFNNSLNQLSKTDGNTVKTLGDMATPRMIHNPVDNNLYFAWFSKFYKTDGTTEGTKLISNKLTYFYNIPEENTLAMAYNKILTYGMPNNDNRFGKEIYEVTADTVKIVKDLDSTTKSSKVRFLLNSGGKTYFRANNEESDFYYDKVFETDGTPEGTRGVDIGSFDDTHHFFVLKKKLFLFRSNMLYKIDFSANRYDEVISFPKYISSKPVQINDKYYFSLAHSYFDSNTEVWVTDGTTAGTTLVNTFNKKNFVHQLAVVNQQLYVFSKSENTIEIWTYQNNNTTPVLLKTINSSGLKITYENFRNKLAFLIDVPNNMQLWITDGTVDGTRQIDTFPSSFAYEYRNIFFTDNHYYFSESYYIGIKVWKSDGTPTGKTLVIDVPNASYGVTSYGQCNNTVYFGLYKNNNLSSNLYKHDLATNITTFLNTVGFLWVNDKRNFQCLNGHLYFAAYERQPYFYRYSLYTSDGTSTGTKEIVSLTMKEYEDFMPVRELYPLNDHELLIKANDRLYNVEWFTFRRCDNPTSLSGTTTDSKIQSSSTFLESTEKLDGDSRVYYFAPKSITLKPGFSVDNTNVFKAEIKNRPCTFRQ